MNVLHVKRMIYYRRGVFCWLELYASLDWCVIIQNTHGSLLSTRHFVRIFGHILALYIQNDLATIGNVASWL